MGGNQQKCQSQQPIEYPEYWKNSMNIELQESNTLPSCIQLPPLIIPFYIVCPRCQYHQFDDVLGRSNMCSKCRLQFQRKEDDESIQIINNGDAQQQYGNGTSILDAIVLSVNERHLQTVTFSMLMINTIVPFFQEKQRIITQGVCFHINDVEFRVVGCSSLMQGVVGIKTSIYCYESYTESTLREIRVYSQKQGIQNELHHYLISHPQENFLIQGKSLQLQDSYIKEVLVLKCSPHSSGRVNHQTRIKSISSVPRLQKIQLSLLRGESIEESSAILQYVVLPYFTGLTRYVERGQILKISQFTFEIVIQEEYGFVIPNQTQFSIDNSNMRVQVIEERNEIHQIESLHRLLNTFIQLSDNCISGCQENEISQLPVRKIDLKLIEQLDQDHAKCLICLCEYELEDIVKTIPCLHYFHDECIDKWLKKSRHCPICKNELQL